MAGLPTPKSREQILSEMLTEYVGLTGINDLNTGSVITQFFDVVARSVARTSGDIFQILRDFSVERATGEALNRLGSEERVYRNSAKVASGKVKITDTSFEKIETKIYAGAPAPNVGTIEIKVSDASSFESTGRIYIGRGTPNVEGPIDYVDVQKQGDFWIITLDSPTKKFHNISESVILGQGGTRNIAIGTVVSSPGTGATPSVNYNVSSAALLLDGENINNNVEVTAQESGSLGNAPAGAITQFSTEPFPNAKVINVVPFTNGSDEESDDDYRDRIKKERLSKGLGTALAVKNAVLGAQAPDENARVVSNEIDTTNPEETILYIDNGEGYEEKTEGVGLEFIVDSAIGGEQNFQLQTGGRQTSIAKAFLESSLKAPYDIRSLDRVAFLVGGIISEHVFPEGSFKAEGAATAFEVVSSINDNPNLTFEATTSESGTKVIVRSKIEDNEFIQVTTPTSGNDAVPKMGFPSNEIATVLLYKNRELLNKNGRTAFVVTKNRFEWSTDISNNDNLIIAVDGTDFKTYNFTNQDFVAEGRHSTVDSQNSLQSWANVINNKITGVTAEVNGEQLKLSSNLGAKNRASIEIDVNSDLVSKGMFSEDIGLKANGNEADFELSRNTAQIKLNAPLKKGESLNLGSEFTRAEIRSNAILGGQTTLPDTGYLWVLVDDIKAEPVEIGLSSDAFVNITKPGNNIVRYETLAPNAFDNVEIGDYVIIWSEDFSVSNRLEARVYSKSSDENSSSLDLRVTENEALAAIEEGPIIFSEGFTVIRTEFVPQKLKVDQGVYNINDIASILNSQLKNATITVDKDEVFVFRTNTEANNGSLFIVDFNDSAKSLSFIKNSQSTSINSQTAFFETIFSDKQFPAFVHGKVTADSFADPINSYILEVQSDEDLKALGVDPSGWVCFAQPYNDSNDVQSTECVEVEKYTGNNIKIEQNDYYKRSRVNDRFYVLNPYDFGHDDSIVSVLDDNPTSKTFSMPLYRTAITDISLSANSNGFRAKDKEGGTVDFTQFFGENFSFDNYKVLMQAKNVIDPGNYDGDGDPLGKSDDAILYKCSEWGRSGEKFKIGYFYPTSSGQEISHIVTVKEDVAIQIFLKSGPARTTTINGTTEWNITSSPLNATTDLVTYAWTGNGNDPGLQSINSGDYVSILSTGEFSSKNQGSYRIENATSSSFTVKKGTNTSEEQTDVSTLETNTISFFEPSETLAVELVEYVDQNLTDYITAELIQDGTTAIDGSGSVTKSTAEDSDFSVEYVNLKDGKNYILASNLIATPGNAHFTFKTPLELYSFNTNTANAYSFNKEQELKLIPTTSLQVTDFFNVLAVTGYSTLGQVKSIERNSNVQLSTDILGAEGAVQVAGGTGNSSFAAIQGSASTIGTQDDLKTLASISSASAAGFHSDQWVKLSALELQKKNTGINKLNSIKITPNTPTVGYSKIEIFDRGIQQRFFGDSRYHSRTRGRTFKIEKQGQLTCISWDGNGEQPYFSKQVELNDIDVKNVKIDKDTQTGIADYIVISGSITFEEVQIGDTVDITGFSHEGNNGTFKVLGISDDGKILRVKNNEGISTEGSVNEEQLITFNSVPVSGDFSLNFDGEITAPILFNATALDIESALENLTNIDDVNVTGDFSTGFNVEFLGVNTETDVPMLVVESSTLDIAINQFERYDFGTIVGSDFDNTNKIEEIDFTNVTATDLDETQQIEEYNFTTQGVTGSYLNQTQHTEDIDFLGLIGSNFDSVTTKWIQLAGDYAYLWYNVTDGLNAQSDPSGNGVGIQVDILSSDDENAIASKTDSAIDIAGVAAITNSFTNNSILKLQFVSGSISPTVDNGTTAGITIQQQGLNAKSIQLAGGHAYIWYNVTDGSNIQSDPGGNGVGIQVDVLSADTDIVISTRTQNSISNALPIAGISSVSDNTGVLTVQYDSGDIINGSDISTGVFVNIIREGLNAKYLEIGGNYAYLWFSVSDQVDPLGVGTSGIQVSILNTDTPSDIAQKAALAITSAAPSILGLKDAIENGNIVTLNYETGNINDSYDINTNADISLIQQGDFAKSFQLGDNSAYIWYSVTDGENIQSNPGGNGLAIQVDVLSTDLTSDIAQKTFNEIDSQLPIVPIDSVNYTPLDIVIDISYTDGNIENGYDVNSGVELEIVVNGENNISITEEIKGSKTGDFSVTSTIQEGDYVNIRSDFSILNRGIFRLIRKFKNSFYIENSNSVEEEVTVSDNLVNIIQNFAIIPSLIFTNGSDIVTSENNLNWTSSVLPGYFIKVQSQGDDKYYKINTIDNNYQVTLTNAFNEDTVISKAVYVSNEFENTNYEIQKTEGQIKLVWSGAGLEPSLEDVRPGDVLKIGTDFSLENRGEFDVVDSGEKLQEITRMRMPRGIDLTSGEYCKIYIADDNSPFHLGYRVDGVGSNVPAAPIPARTIEIDVLDTDQASEVAIKTAAVLNNTPFDVYFSVETEEDDIIITNVLHGPTEDFENVDIGGEFSIETLQQGRRNFISYVNSKGSTESATTITDILEVNREAIQFKEYEGTTKGDTFSITNEFLGEGNTGSYKIFDVISKSEIIVEGTTSEVDKTLLDANFNKIFVEEQNTYVGYKKIDFIATNPSNLNAKNVIFDTSNQFEKIGELSAVSMSALGKLQFPTDVVKGVDSYKFHTGLIGEANRIVYGDPRDNTTYPGVSAAGAEIFIKAPLVRRVEVSINVRVKTGVPFSVIVEQVRNSVASLINSNPIGQPIPISNIISTVDAIVGVQAVAISSPQYDAQNDVIRINAGEKALVLDVISDVLVSKID